eukprot:364823-Chlamydomonas_euryale.AAC.3
MRTRSAPAASVTPLASLLTWRLATSSSATRRDWCASAAPDAAPDTDRRCCCGGGRRSAAPLLRPRTPASAAGCDVCCGGSGASAAGHTSSVHTMSPCGRVLQRAPLRSPSRASESSTCGARARARVENERSCVHVRACMVHVRMCACVHPWANMHANKCGCAHVCMRASMG